MRCSYIITTAFGCLLFAGVLSGQDAILKAAKVNVPQQMKDFVAGRLEELKKIAPHVKEEFQLRKEDVNFFNSRLKEAEDNIAGGNWAKAFYAVSDSKLGYFITEALYKENRIRRSMLWAGPFPETGSAELENDYLNRRIENTLYPAPRTRGLGWQYLEFETFLGSADEIPLKTLLPKVKGKAVVYLTGFLWPDFPLAADKPTYQEGAIGIKGARVLKVWVGGEEVFKEENGAAVGKDQPTKITVKRKGGWWWLMFKVAVEPKTKTFTLEYMDESGKPIYPAKTRDYRGFSGVNDAAHAESLARLALWAPRNFGKVSEKLAAIRNWFEHLETAYQAYIKEHGKLPAANLSLPLTNAFTDGGAIYFDYQVYSGGNHSFIGDSLRVVVNGPIPMDTWSVYDPKNGDYSPGQIFFALKIPRQPFIGMDWVSWCSFLEQDAKKRDAISKTNRFATYELLPAPAK